LTHSVAYWAEPVCPGREAHMSILRRLFAALLIAGAIGIWFGMAPDSREASFEEAISEALLVDTANNARTEGAPQQAVVNGWTAKDLLTVIAREGAQPSDERPAALLVLVVVGIAGMIAMSPRTERVVEPEASAAVQDAHASV
jgi:uncharacterized membrane protein YraQ (UPF0718 family)